MTAELFIADGRKIYGGGSDEAGRFTWIDEVVQANAVAVGYT
jgi:hypothetical protein